MGLILCYCGFQCILVVFGHFAFYRLFQGAIYGIGLIALYIMGFISTHCGFQSVLIVFGHFASDSGLHFAADSGGQVFVNGVGHVFVSPVHQVLSRMGNHSFFSGILDIRSSLLGVGLVFSVTSVGIESVIAQVGGGFVISINYSNLSFSCILADGGGLGTVHCFVFHGEGAVVIADHVSGDFLVRGFWFCVIAQILADFFRPYDGFSCGVYDPCIGSGGDRAAIFIENGFCRVFHSANGIIDFGGHIARINLGIVVWFASQSNMVCFELTANFELTLNFHILCGEFVIDCHISSGDIGSTDVPGGLDKTAACIEAGYSCGSCFQGTRFHSSCGLDGTCTGINPCSDYISICAHCKVISSYGQCTCGELSVYSSIIGNSQGIAFQIPFCFNTSSFQLACCFNTSSFQLVCYIQTARRNRT